MNYWHGLLIGILIGGTLGTIATALAVSCRTSDDLEEEESNAKQYIKEQ
jgi:gas vesicle protein